jgi:hypothetical protein
MLIDAAAAGKYWSSSGTTTPSTEEAHRKIFRTITSIHDKGSR